MADGFNAFLKSPVGQMAYRPFQVLLHFARKRANPDIPLNHAMQTVRYRDREYRIEVRRWSTSDALAVAQCFEDQQYDMPGGAQGRYVDKVYREVVDSGKKPLILDCGANIGASVLWFSARYPEARIVAIEPSPDNFELLRRNTRGVKVELVEAGIGDKDGSAWLESNGNGMDCRTSGRDTGVQVRIVSLASVMANEAEHVPFLLKVDIEGAEQQLFKASRELLNRFPLIVMEPHDWMIPGERSSAEFFRFHADSGREIALKHENLASIAYPRAQNAHQA